MAKTKLRDEQVIAGISNGHDSNFTVLGSGGTIVVIEKERIAREKHSRGKLFPYIECLDRLEFNLDSVEELAIVPPIWEDAGYDWALSSGRLPEALDDVSHGRVKFRGQELKATFFPHHLAHAAYAYFSSEFTASHCLTIDAGGYFCDASFSEWSDSRLVDITPLTGFHLGTLWSVLARKIFGDVFAAGRVMGLASYGHPKYMDQLERDFVVPCDNLAGLLGRLICLNYLALFIVL